MVPMRFCVLTASTSRSNGGLGHGQGHRSLGLKHGPGAVLCPYRLHRRRNKEEEKTFSFLDLHYFSSILTLYVKTWPDGFHGFLSNQESFQTPFKNSHTCSGIQEVFGHSSRSFDWWLACLKPMSFVPGR